MKLVARLSAFFGVIIALSVAGGANASPGFGAPGTPCVVAGIIVGIHNNDSKESLDVLIIRSEGKFSTWLAPPSCDAIFGHILKNVSIRNAHESRAWKMGNSILGEVYLNSDGGGVSVYNQELHGIEMSSSLIVNIGAGILILAGVLFLLRRKLPKKWTAKKERKKNS